MAAETVPEYKTSVPRFDPLFMPDITISGVFLGGLLFLFSHNHGVPSTAHAFTSLSCNGIFSPL